MKLRTLFYLIIYLSVTLIYSQGWKTYPYTPSGSLISFPVDEGRHTSEETEWWYTTGHVTGNTTGNTYSYMLTYFYHPSYTYDGFRIFNVTKDDNGQKIFDTKAVKYDLLSTDRLEIKVTGLNPGKTEFWKNKKDPQNNIIPFEYKLSASSGKAEINLEYTAIKTPLILCDNGKFDQGLSSYTYYYSQTKLNVTGTIIFDGITEEVTGTSWIDRQYGTFNGFDNEKYEWFNIQLSNGMDINVWNLFTNDYQIPDNHKYRILSAYVDDNTQYTTKDFNIDRLQYKFTDDEEMCYSQKWRITSGKNNIDLIVSVLHSDSEVLLPFRFYEGTTTITGTVNGQPVTGLGFSELLHTYELPDVSLTHPIDGNPFFSSENITWTVNNPDDGNPLLFDLAYSIDNKQNFKTIAQGISKTNYHWEDPDITTGEDIWFKITAYSSDKTLSDSVVSSSSSYFTLPVELLSKNNIVLYPNPGKNEILIDLNNGVTIYSYQIYNINGKIIQTKSLQKESLLRIDIRSFVPGIYFIRLYSNNKEMYSKFIVK
jgi:predicted secreted hydrolase